MRVITTVLAISLVAGLSGLAQAGGPAIYPLDKVKKGQKGYGLTVFQGTKVERFEFEVIGVVSNFLPKQDIILLRSSDPKIIEVGFARGMSGSPLYIEGKVACAFSYGFPFSKGQIGACTPIAYMLNEAKRPARGPSQIGIASAAEWRRHKPVQAALAPVANKPMRAIDSWMYGAPLPAQRTMPTDSAQSGTLAPASIPLAAAGLGPTAFQQARQIFAPYGIEVSQGGGGSGKGDRGPKKYVMGGALGAQLARGDVSMVATGTVSYVNDRKVLAFGHPFFQFGEVYMPAVTAEVHTVVPSINMAFKMASPLRQIGSMVQDRQSAIVVDTKTKTALIPVKIRVRGPDGEDTFDSEVLRHRMLTPPLVGMMVNNAAKLFAPDLDAATVTIKSELRLRGYKPLVFHDYAYSDSGPGAAISEARALRVLMPLLMNPFAPVTIDSLTVDVGIEYKTDYVEIQQIRLPSAELTPGKTTTIEVVLHRFAGGFHTQRIPLTIPKRLAGSTVKLEVAAGDRATYDIAPPQNLDDLIRLLRKTYPANTLVATIYTPNQGVELGGRLLPNLPDSALDTVRLSASTQKNAVFTTVVRSVLPQKRVVLGKTDLVVKIAELD